MTEQEIKNYFGALVIYQWVGNLAELQVAQELLANSYNVIRTNDVVYFAPQQVPSDPRATVWFDNTGVVN
jgi:hypothetical protein